MKIIGVGIDAAFANMGFARVEIDLGQQGAGAIQPVSLSLASTEPSGLKGVRMSSDRLRRAKELQGHLQAACAGAQVAFVEVPEGSQNASAAYGLGIATGVLASCPIPIVEVSPMEVKEAVAGKRVRKGATKDEIIKWAEANWPGAPWLRAAHKAKSKGVWLPAGRLLAENEHLADAMASIVAGLSTPQFRQVAAILSHTQTNHAIPGTSDQRPASGRTRRVLL